MSDVPAIELAAVGKMYKIFSSKSGSLLDALGLPGRRRASYREFWALRGIDFSLGRGERLGIIGRNGAGKSTLLRLITQNIEPTEGDVHVRGNVQALLETGGGLHPEFTGYENIRAALSFLGLRSREIAAAEADIAEFTELGRFLEQPFKTYSTGMQARLAFAIATTIRPEILIVDEVLGAGDAYFFAKSTARMRTLLESGASVLLVSHALDQIVRFCDEAIWLDRGRIVQRGPSTEVVKSYEKFIRQLEDRRLRARNEKSLSNRYDAFERESYTDFLAISFDGDLEVSEVELIRDGETEDNVLVGGPQDADPAQSASVLADTSSWSHPSSDGPRLFRSAGPKGPGIVIFHLWLLQLQSKYFIRAHVRGQSGAMTVRHGETILGQLNIAENSDWQEVGVALDLSLGQDASVGPGTIARSVSRWPGEGALLIERVRLESDQREQAVFVAGSPLTLVIEARAHMTDVLPVTPAVTIYRADGILVTNLVGETFDVNAVDDAVVWLRMDLDELNLGNGHYLISLALYRELSDTPRVYDLLDRSFDFEVQGNATFDNGVFRHGARWVVEQPESLSTSQQPA